MSTKITHKKRPPVTAHANTRIVRLQGGGLRFLDAHEIPQKDFQVVTRSFQGFDTTQHWRINDVAAVAAPSSRSAAAVFSMRMRSLSWISAW